MTRLAPHVANDCCRSCGSSDLAEVIAFGESPLADRLVAPETTEEDYVAPLTLLHCNSCALCQIRETVAPRILFGPEYPYYSSVSRGLMKHFADSAEAIIAAQDLGPDDLVVEAASNDGYMLKNFHDAGVAVLGIDPADGPVCIARKKGIETVHDFFGADLAKRLAAEGRSARVFLANNVLAHVADVNDFVDGIASILAEDGLAVIEAPYLLDMLDGGAFDTIYHQHLLYLSLTSLVPLFERHGLHLNDVERVWMHGGSLRLFVGQSPGRTERLDRMLADEERRGVRHVAVYGPFLEKIERLRRETRAVLDRLQSESITVAGYGAAAKATTLMHVFGIGQRDLAFIADRSARKHGLNMPVTHVPIVSPDEMRNRKPDAVLLLAWNFADEIVAENRDWLSTGGRFIVPVPEVREVVAEGEYSPG